MRCLSCADNPEELKFLQWMRGHLEKQCGHFRFTFCVQALDDALNKGRRQIFNTDQGCQFTGDDFLDVLRVNSVAISMDGRGRVSDNIFVERLWRRFKYEEVYLKAYQNVAEARHSIAAYFDFYNHERLHQALSYRAPRQVF